MWKIHTCEEKWTNREEYRGNTRIRNLEIEWKDSINNKISKSIRC